MNIQEIAKECGVTVTDILSLVGMITNSLKQDNMHHVILEASESERVEYVSAYLSSEVTKFKNFCFSLLTNTDKKCAFDQYMFNKMQEV